MADFAARAARLARIGVSFAVACIAAACGGEGSSGSGPATTTYTLSGSVTGLTNDGLQLSNGASSVALGAGATTFIFAENIAAGANYSVSIGSIPAGLTCSIDNPSGTVGSHDISNIAISCSPTTFSIGGAAIGLSADGLVLSDGAENVSLAAGATSFVFTKPLASGNSYAVSILTMPASESCVIANATGTVSLAPISNISVTCSSRVSESVLYSFGASSSSDGMNPTGTLIQAGDGSIYGATSNGGTQGKGAVFKISAAGVESLLYSFGSTSALDGVSPTHGGVTIASDGNLYLMTKSGGDYSLGAIVKVSPAGVESVLHSFGAPGDGASPEGNLIQAADGALYGMTSAGGVNNTGAAIKITLSGQESVLYSFGAANSGDGITPIGSLVQASDGNLYGMTNSGGSSGTSGGTVFRLSLAGAETVLHSFVFGSTDGAFPTGNLVQASDGNLYGLASGGATGAGVIVKVTLAGAVSILSNFSPCCGVSSGGSLIQANDGFLYGLGAGGANGTGTLLRASTDGSLAAIYLFGNAASGDGSNPGYSSLIQGSDGALYGATPTGGSNNTGAIVKLVLNPGL